MIGDQSDSMRKKKRKTIYLGDGKVRLLGLKCPRCGADADGATGISSSGWPGEPYPGALVTCAYCGGLSMYTETLLLRKVERPERRKILRERPELRKLLEVGELAAQAYQARKKAEKAPWN